MFDMNLTYVFQAKLVNFGENPTEADLDWSSKCNNRIVKITEGGYKGIITIDGIDYIIIKPWCRILDNTKVEAFCQATGQENPNK